MSKSKIPVDPKLHAGAGHKPLAETADPAGAEGDETVEVGYGRPPQHTRFRPGVSGNPRGRPRQSRNFSTVMNEELNQTVAVREGGKVRRLPKRVAIAKGLLNKVLQGDPRAATLLIPLILRLEAEQAAKNHAVQVLSQDDQQLLADYVRRVTGPGPDASET